MQPTGCHVCIVMWKFGREMTILGLDWNTNYVFVATPLCNCLTFLGTLGVALVLVRVLV